MEIFREVSQTVDHPGVETVFKGVRERTRFDANLGRHHHFVCTRCGLTRNFYSEKFSKLKLPESVQRIGQAEMTQVEVKGVCHQCAKTENQANNLK